MIGYIYTRFERHEPDYAILNDVGHGYAVMHYYVTRDSQVSQFEAHGFEVLDCLDLDGTPVGPGEASRTIPGSSTTSYGGSAEADRWCS